GRLERDDTAVDRDRRLAGIDRADRARGAKGGFDVAALCPPRANSAKRAGGDHQVGRHLMRADDAHAALLKEADSPGKHVVVAADDDRQDVLEASHGREIEADALEIGARADVADKDKIAAAPRAQDLV